MDFQLTTILWLAALVVFGIVEASCPCLLSVWFAAGSLVAAIASELGAEIWLQVILFVVVSTALLAALRPLLRKYFVPRLQKTNADSLVGRQVYVCTPVDNDEGVGQVKVNGIEWSARSTDGTHIPNGTLVRIERIEGVRLYVTPAVPVK